MAKLSLSKAWDESRSALGRDGKLYATVALAMFFLPGVIADVANPNSGGLPTTLNDMLLLAVVAIIGLIGQLAVIRLALGSRSTVGEAIGHGARRAPAYIAATILWLAPFVIAAYAIGLDAFQAPQRATPGAILAAFALILVGVFFAIRMAMTSSVASVENAGPLEILRRSWQLTKGHWWRLFGYFLIYLVVMLVVMAAVGAIVGILTSLVFGPAEPLSLSALVVACLTQLASAAITIGFLVMLARIYAQLSAPAHADVTVPSSGS